MTKSPPPAPKVDVKAIPYASVVNLIHKNLPNIGYPITFTHVAGLFWALVLGWTSMGVIGSSFVTDLLAVIYPAWQSYRCDRDKTSPSQWLAYWTIYALFFVVETGGIVADNLPFYYSIKLVILMWCMYPGAKNGAVVVYSGLAPILAMLEVVMSEGGGGRLRKISFSEGPTRKPSKEELKQPKMGKDDPAKQKDQGKSSWRDHVKNK